jgi:IS5 family transposase
MAEVGLVDFAKCALAIAKKVMPLYRSKYSKHTFTQPQLLAILCLMRYEDWTFRETEVRLQEHIELRMVLGLKQTPDYTTFYRFMRRLSPTLIQTALQETALQTLPDRGTKRAVFAVDATGLAPGAISTFFINRKRDRGEGLPWRYWLKWIVVVETKHQLLLAQIAKRGPYNDCALLRPLVDIAHQVMPASLVLADGEFDSERNHKHIREIHHMQSIIPAKRGKKTWRLKGIRTQMKSNFPAKKYSQRNLIETVFSVVKRKLSARAPGHSLATQAMQALILGLAYNLYKL